MKKFILPLVTLAAVTFGVISIVRSQPKHEATTPPSPPPVSPYQHTVAAVGLVETSTENIAIGTPLSDVVREVFVTVGQTVKIGEPLFRLDDRHLRAELAMRQADLRVADSQVEVNAAMLDDVARHLTFAESLKNKNAISAEDLAQRQSAVATAREAEVTTGLDQPGAELLGDRAIAAGVVDHDHLSLRLTVAQRAQAALERGAGVVRDDDRGDDQRDAVSTPRGLRVRPGRS